MTCAELYAVLNEKIPASLSCSWDNDGLMCCSDPERVVRRVLVALDITGGVIDEAIAGGYDAIVSHHPLIFLPLRALNPGDHVASKVMRLVREGITAMSFHTRLDAVEGGVNDTLAAAIGLCDVVPFGQDGEAIGRIGTLEKNMSVAEFAALVKRAIGAEGVQAVDAGKPVYHVAVLGGSGSDDVKAARAAGADTYLSGELKHNWLTDAPDLGINLVAAGHFYTEDPVCRILRDMILNADQTVTVTVTNSNPVRVF